MRSFFEFTNNVQYLSAFQSAINQNADNKKDKFLNSENYVYSPSFEYSSESEYSKNCA